MINLLNLNLKRAIVHTIFAKEEGQESALMVPSESLITIDENVSYTILERLSKSIEKKAKTFSLTIDDSHSTSFYHFAHNISELNDDEFKDSSGKIAQLLANAQTSSRHSGGYLIIIDAENDGDGRKAVIVIKAELQEALVYYEQDIKLIQNLFLSPAQKMFKFGMIYQRDEPEKADLPENFTDINKEWGSVIFDEQFRVDSKPAEYFYKDFLGFTTIDNAPIQTKRFFDKTEQFIKNYYEDYVQKDDVLRKLNDTLIDEQNRDLNPLEFLDNTFEKEELKEQYKNEVLSTLPPNISKDNTLIRSNLNIKKINFPNNIKISGPIDFMDVNVEIIKDDDELREISTNQSSYTIVKIFGKPYSKE